VAEDEQATSTVVFAIEPVSAGAVWSSPRQRRVRADATAAATSWDLRVLSLWLVARWQGLIDPVDTLFAAGRPDPAASPQRLVQDGPDTASHLAVDLPVTRQAVVKHLQALAEAGLAAPERRGREVRYRATPEPLAQAVGWLVSAGARWDDRLGRLDRLARREGAGSGLP
jgi:DNA-binding transcriptional ArsR family regulator